MSEQIILKKQILDFSRSEEHDNKRCIDCASPHPQWASANNAVFMCIQCAGVHRGFGVHISFVRSVTMDTWKPEEVKKMMLGGNRAFREFLQSYESPSPDYKWKYTEDMHTNAAELYGSWACVQYREKLSAEMTSKEWTPSAPSAAYLASQADLSRPPSSQSLRTRGSQKNQPSNLRHGTSASPSPASSPAVERQSSLTGSGTGTGTSTPTRNGPTLEQKAANEKFFASLGTANSQRPEDLPPSQGGRYSGFGSSPSPPPPSSEAFSLSSQALPTLQDVQTDPAAALSKGWGFLSSALAGAGKAMSENIIQPGMQTVRENAPGVQQRIGVFTSTAKDRIGDLGGAVKDRTGVDVAEGWGSLVDKVKGMNVGVGRPDTKGYTGVADGWGEFEEGSALYHDEPDSADGDDFFSNFEGQHQGSTSAAATAASKPETPKEIEREGWDDWKDF